MENSKIQPEKLPPFEKKLLQWGKRKKSGDRIGGELGIFIEGSKLIHESLQANHPLTAVWYTPKFAASEPGLLDRLKEYELQRFQQVSAKMMKTISDMTTPPGIAAVAVQPGFLYREPGDPFSLIVMLTKVQDPGNLGTVIRTADYFGVDELWLGRGSADPYGAKVLRGTMGSSFRLPVVRVDDIEKRVARFRQKGTSVWAAVAHDDGAHNIITTTGSNILLIGAESQGLQPNEIELADHKVYIPGAKRSESLNLSVAASILIYSATSGRLNSQL